MSFIDRLGDKFEAVGAEEVNVLDMYRHNSPLPKTVQWCSIEETRERLQSGMYKTAILHKEYNKLVEYENDQINEGVQEVFCPAGKSMSLSSKYIQNKVCL